MGRKLKICCGITTIFIVALIVVMVVVFFTMLKPKQPKITALPVNVLNYSLLLWPYQELNLSLALEVTIDNPNYGSFTYQNTVSNISYHGTLVAEAYVAGDTFPAHATRNISSIVNVQADKILTSPNFSTDYSSGMLNLTSLSELHGKVSVFNIFKLKATAYSNCDVTIFIVNGTGNSTCTSRVKL